MNRVALADLPSDADGSDVDRRRLDDALGTTGLAVVHYRVAPGGRLPAGLHAHADQEEVFHVLRGTAAFDTLGRWAGETTGRGAGSEGPAGSPEAGGGGDRPRARADDLVRTVTVDAGGTVRFAPGEFQSGRNAGEDDLVLLAVGAPRDAADLRFPVGCPDCDGRELRLTTDEEPRFVCPDCGASRVPTPCPDCGGDDLRVRPADPPPDEADAAPTRRAGHGGPPTVVVCRDCEATFATPPVAGEW